MSVMAGLRSQIAALFNIRNRDMIALWQNEKRTRQELLEECD